MDLVAERIAGPFEMPWSVGVLPDGSFLVTERPGRLQHVTQTAGTYAVDGVPPVLYSGTAGSSTSRSIRISRRTA
jgi:glucose/arabinose dehydrogenase